MPFQHSEDPKDQARSLALFEKLGNATLDRIRTGAQVDHRSIRALSASECDFGPAFVRSRDRLAPRADGFVLNERQLIAAANPSSPGPQFPRIGGSDESTDPLSFWCTVRGTVPGAGSVFLSSQIDNVPFGRWSCPVSVRAPMPISDSRATRRPSERWWDEIDGPVLLCGHSYGGMVISQASYRQPKVSKLVYLCAFVPESAESLVVDRRRSAGTLDSTQGRRFDAAGPWQGGRTFLRGLRRDDASVGDRRNPSQCAAPVL